MLGTEVLRRQGDGSANERSDEVPPEQWKHSMDFVHNIDYARGADGGLCGVAIFIHPMMAHLTILIRHLEQAGAIIHHLKLRPPQSHHAGEMYILVPVPKRMDLNPTHPFSKASLTKSASWAVQVTPTFLDARLVDKDVRPSHDPVYRPFAFDLPIPDFPPTAILGPEGPLTTAYRYFCTAARDGPVVYTQDMQFHTTHRPDYSSIGIAVIISTSPPSAIDLGARDGSWSIPSAPTSPSTPFSILHYLVDRRSPPLFLGGSWLKRIAEGDMEVMSTTYPFAFAHYDLRRRVHEHHQKITTRPMTHRPIAPLPRRPLPSPPNPPLAFPTFAPNLRLAAGDSCSESLTVPYLGRFKREHMGNLDAIERDNKQRREAEMEKQTGQTVS